MKKTEYEYSYKVKSLKPYIEYCEINGYELTKKTKQERIIYRNENKTMARVTIESDKNNNIVQLLDFKEDKLTGEIVIERKESLPITFDDLTATESVLSFLDYRKDNVLKRIRYVYTKGEISFELDEYTQPETALVVAIEGEKEMADLVYKEVEEFGKKYNDQV